MSFTRRPGSERPRQTSRREDHHIVKNAHVQSTVSSATIQAQVAPSLEVPVSSRAIRRCPAEEHLGSRRPLRVLPLTPTYGCLHLERCHAQRNWTAAEWNQVDFSDKSKFNLNSHDNRARVWRPRGECLNPAIALQRHTTPTAGVRVWGVIAYNTRSPLVLIRVTMTPMTSCNHMCCHSCNGFQDPLFNKTMLGLKRQGFPKTVSALLLPFLALPDPQICLQSSISVII
ncbi:transposable element Tcb2 transposase [Trichonephila clavipes]|nr:transposable element Tcb2 transposase [Trichonephila clavipes]